MTQKQLDTLEAARRMYKDFRGFAQLHQQRLCNVVLDQIDRCDHLYPDGSSAIKGQMFCSICEICGWSDL